jgi:hypothetical protein
MSREGGISGVDAVESSDAAIINSVCVWALAALEARREDDIQFNTRTSPRSVNALLRYRGPGQRPRERANITGRSNTVRGA